MNLRSSRSENPSFIKTSIADTNTSTTTNIPSQKKRRLNKTVLKVLLLIQFITIILAGYFFYQYLQEKQRTQTPTSAEQTNEVKQSVGKLIKLDPNSEPTIATIKDVDALKKENPEFYKDAQNGDILLIYPNRAILYNKDENIIVNVAPIINNDTTTSPTVSPTVFTTQTKTPTPTPTIKPTATKKP